MRCRNVRLSRVQVLFIIKMKGDEAECRREIAWIRKINPLIVGFALPLLDLWQITPGEDMPLIISKVATKSLFSYIVLFPHTQLLLDICINSEYLRDRTTSSTPAPLSSRPHLPFTETFCDRKWFTEKEFPNPLASCICLCKHVLINSKFFLF